MEVILPGFSKAIFFYLCVVNTLELYLYIILGCVLFLRCFRSFFLAVRALRNPVGSRIEIIRERRIKRGVIPFPLSI